MAISNSCFRDAGTLINRRYILTAAHCQNNPLPIEQAVVGEHILGRDPDCEQGCAPNQVFQVGQEDVIVHPDWDPINKRNKNPINDIALIRLQKPGKKMQIRFRITNFVLIRILLHSDYNQPRLQIQGGNHQRSSSACLYPVEWEWR